MSGAVLIGLRSALLILCIVALVDQWRTGMPRDPTRRLWTWAWIGMITGTGLIWTPFTLARQTGNTLDPAVADAVRIAGSVVDIISILLALAAFAHRLGGKVRRAIALYALIPVVFVTLAVWSRL